MRETGMTAYEMMLSESQERMLMVLKPGAEKPPSASSANGSSTSPIIGHTTDTGTLVVRHGGAVEADIPLAALAHDAPVYERPWTRPSRKPGVAPEDGAGPERLLGAARD